MIKYKEDSNLSYEIFNPVFESADSINLIGLIMVKNQEDNILKTLKSIHNICDSITVVDTGSTDRTVSRIKEFYPSVDLRYIEWEENYAKMRNTCLEFVPNNTWILFFDSDETLKSDCNFYEIRSFLNHLDKTYLNRDIICTIKQGEEGRPVFFQPERFIKKTSSLKYFGYVHEEPRSTSSNGLVRINTNIQVINLGLNNDEIKKFDKEKRYSLLLIKNLKKEPNNPRWPSLMTAKLVENGYLTYKEYIRLLNKHILIDQSKPISISNIKITKYLPYLLERYIIELVKDENYNSAQNYINVGKQLYPYNANFIVFEVSIFLKQIEKSCFSKLEDTVDFIKNNDSILIHEASEGSEEAISGIVVRLLCMLGKYEQAKEIYSSISDEYIKIMLTNEQRAF